MNRQGVCFLRRHTLSSGLRSRFLCVPNAGQKYPQFLDFAFMPPPRG